MPSTQVSKDQMVNLLLIVPRYDANQLHVCHTLMILQVGLQAIKLNWSFCVNTLMTVNCWIIKSWNNSVSFIVCELF